MNVWLPFLLMLLYTLLCVLIMFVMNLRKDHFWGILSVFIFNLYGFLLNPQLFKEILKTSQDQLYIANVVTGWASPLQHATYHMHNFGYDLLPKLWQTYFIYVVLISMCLLLALLSIRKYNFNFSGGLN